MKTYLNVSFDDKDLAKQHGAKWDFQEKLWFVNDFEGLPFEYQKKWFLAPDEGMAGVGGLYVDLIPQSCFFVNLRDILKKTEWDVVRKHAYKKSGYRCSICGGKGESHPVEAHERWSFDIESKTQVLTDVQALCPSCHRATHYGFAQIMGFDEEAFERLMFVNGWNKEKTATHIKDAFILWKELSQFTFSLEIMGYFEKEKLDLVIDIDERAKEYKSSNTKKSNSAGRVAYHILKNHNDEIMEIEHNRGLNIIKRKRF